jgi:hypothetical protein
MKRRLWWATLAALCAGLLAPLLIADVPPVLDYPNHLARLALLAAGPDDPVLGRIFTPHWTIIPDLAIDVIGPPLLHVLPVHVAGRGLLAFVLLLNLAGALALHRALFGRVAWWPLASGLVAYNSGFLLGFLNWQIGCGLAMLAAALWLTWRERRPACSVLGASMVAVALFFCHLMGLAFFLALIGGAELSAVRSRRDLPRRAAALLPVLVPPMALALLTDLRDAPAATHWMNPHDKLVQVASSFINYSLPFDLLSAALIYGGVALGLATGCCIVAPRARFAFAALALLYLPLPFDLMSGSFLDTRVALMLGFLTFAAVDFPRLPRWAGWALAAACALLFSARMGVLADAWWGQRRDLAELREAIAPVPPGATVYFTNVPPTEAPAYWESGPRQRRISFDLRTEYHLPALLLIERGAYWHELFANPAQQPIALRPAYAELARVAHAIPPHAALRHGAPGLGAFDYVLMLEAAADPDLSGFAPQCLRLLARTEFAALFKVNPPACK